jgi:predicted nuclease of predicted toxin-antitoxin system
MKFFLDENFPKAACSFLAARGHSVLDVRDSSQRGADDSMLFEWAQEEGAVFLTTDRDFFHTIPHLYEMHCGVIVVALRQPNRINILSRLEWFLDHFGADEIQNRVVQLRDRTYITIPPIEPR